jgi:hypothetical protein
MSPVWMIEGGATAVEDGLEAAVGAGPTHIGRVNGAETLSERNLAERRLSALAEAVREHESTSRHYAVPPRPQDLALYRRLRQICGTI